jgi:predicted acetyltransferase
MTVAVRDCRASSKDRQWLTGVYGQYLVDLAPQGTGAFPILGEIGHREPDLLASWFNDASAHILTVLRDHQPAGFALVREKHAATVGAANEYTMAEFFVARQWRRHAVGRASVRLILDRFVGRWHVMEYTRNAVAVAFWRNVVREYTHGQYQERAGNGEVHQYFESVARAVRG